MIHKKQKIKKMLCGLCQAYGLAGFPRLRASTDRPALLGAIDDCKKCITLHDDLIKENPGPTLWAGPGSFRQS